MVDRVALKLVGVACGEIVARGDVISFENAGEGKIPSIPGGPDALIGPSAAGGVLRSDFPIQFAARYTGNVNGALDRVAGVDSLAGTMQGV